jgi:hypothetical protein
VAVLGENGEVMVDGRVVHSVGVRPVEKNDEPASVGGISNGLWTVG